MQYYTFHSKKKNISPILKWNLEIRIDFGVVIKFIFVHFSGFMMQSKRQKPGLVFHGKRPKYNTDNWLLCSCQANGYKIKTIKSFYIQLFLNFTIWSRNWTYVGSDCEKTARDKIQFGSFLKQRSQQIYRMNLNS